MVCNEQYIIKKKKNYIVYLSLIINEIITVEILKEKYIQHRIKLFPNFHSN